MPVLLIGALERIVQRRLASPIRSAHTPPQESILTAAHASFMQVSRRPRVGDVPICARFAMTLRRRSAVYVTQWGPDPSLIRQ